MSEQQRKESILVVDDTPMNLQLLSLMLSGRGYDVTAVHNGMEALKAVKEKLPDLILLDIMMPEIDGYEVCRRLKEDERTQPVPIIFISALEATDNKIQAFAAGGVDYVTKPFQVPEVLARVETHLALRELQRELQKAKEELEVQVVELQQRNEELDAFAQAIAQDLKRPLTSIIGFADTLEETAGTLAEDELRASLRSVARNGRKMDEIIEKLLLLSGVRQMDQVETSALDMGSIVDRARERLAPLIEDRQAEIAAPEEWPRVEGYEPWVEEVWSTYIGEAIRNSPPEPRIKLGAEPQADDSVRFWVQCEALTAREDDRGGLGQFIARRILERLGRVEKAAEGPQGEHEYVFTLPAAD